jgi:hypothetical protein
VLSKIEEIEIQREENSLSYFEEGAPFKYFIPLRFSRLPFDFMNSI